MLVGAEPGVRVEAPRRAGVERAVGDDLVAADAHEPAGALDRLAGAQPGLGRALEVLRVDAEAHAQRVEPARGAAHPVVAVPAHLVVDDADDASRRGGSGRVGDPGVERVIGDVVELADEPEAVVLAEHAARTGCSSRPCRRAAAVFTQHVQVARDEHDRHVAGDRVEQVDALPVGPEAVAVAHADHLGGAGPDGRRDQLGRVGGGGHVGEVDPACGHRPLRDVHVPVPESRDDPPAVEVDALGAGCRGQRARRRDRAHHARLDVHVERGIGAEEPDAGDDQRRGRRRAIRPAHPRAARSASCVRRISAASAAARTVRRPRARR